LTAVIQAGQQHQLFPACAITSIIELRPIWKSLSRQSCEAQLSAGPTLHRAL